MFESWDVETFVQDDVHCLVRPDAFVLVSLLELIFLQYLGGQCDANASFSECVNLLTVCHGNSFWLVVRLVRDEIVEIICGVYVRPAVVLCDKGTFCPRGFCLDTESLGWTIVYAVCAVLVRAYGRGCKTRWESVAIYAIEIPMGVISMFVEPHRLASSPSWVYSRCTMDVVSLHGC